MKQLAFILVVLHLLLTGCIVTYRDFPNATRDALSMDHVTQPLFYHVEPVDEAQKEYGNRWISALSMVFAPGYYPAQSRIDPFGQPGYHAVGRTLADSGIFSDLNEAQSPPKAGFFCKVEFEPIPPSTVVQYFLESQLQFINLGILALIPALTLLPYYTDEGGTTAIYSLYQDSRLLKAYRYPIRKKGAGWIGLLPFAWINYFTTDLAGAVEGATLQFLIDAQRDGCFAGSPDCASSKVAPKVFRSLPQLEGSGSFGQRIEESFQQY
ncbi:MAG: hypothetical protein HXY51_13020 [Nitrospirae bacterium]|nr:hypothetical protein [Nitrospirota bacterium]